MFILPCVFSFIAALVEKKAMGFASHGLHYAETKMPWGPSGSPMAPCHYAEVLRGLSEPS